MLPDRHMDQGTLCCCCCVCDASLSCHLNQIWMCSVQVRSRVYVRAKYMCIDQVMSCTDPQAVDRKFKAVKDESTPVFTATGPRTIAADVPLASYVLHSTVHEYLHCGCSL